MKIYDFPTREITVKLVLIGAPTAWFEGSEKGLLDFYTGGADVTNKATGETLGHVGGTVSGHAQISSGEFLFWIPADSLWKSVQDLLSKEDLDKLQQEWKANQDRIREGE